MTITVELFDGTKLEFPDGTDQSVISRVAKEQTAARQGAKPAAPASGGLPQEIKDRIAAAKKTVAEGGSHLTGVTPERAGEIAYVNSLTESAMKRGGQPGEPYDPGAFGAFMGNLAPGLTFGAADEISAGIGSLFEDRTYDEILSGLRDRQKLTEEQHPTASMAGKVTGALAPGALATKFIAGARTLPGMVGQGMGWGAAGGGLQGFLEGEGGFRERMDDAWKTALLGGGVGGLAPLVGAGLKHAWRSGAEALRNSRVGSQVGKDLGTSNTTGRVLADIIGADDEAAMRAALARGGPNAMLADVSPQATGALDMAMRSPIPAARDAARAVEGRAAAAYDDVTRALDTAMGTPTGIKTAQDAIVTGSAPARKAAYDAAYAAPIDYSTDAGAKLLDEITPRIPKEAIGYANRLMRARGEKSAQIMASIADDGTVTFTSPPDVRQWDYIKQGLDMMAETGEGAGALGGQTRLGSAYQGLAREVRDAVGELVPEYKAALGVASDAISERKAVEFGSKLLRTSTTPEMAAEAIKDATPSELVAMRQGVRSQIQNVLGDVRKVASDQNLDARQVSKAFSDLSSDNATSKLAMLMGDEWPALKAELDRAGVALGLRARTSANSATFGRTAADAAITDAVTPGALRQGKPLEAIKSGIASALGASPDAIRRMRDDVKGEIAAVLTRQGGGTQAIDSILAALAGNPVNPAAGNLPRRMLETLLLGNTGNASSAVLGLTGR